MTEPPLSSFLISHLDMLWTKLIEHIYLSFSATFLAIIIGVPLGIWILRQPKMRNFVLGTTSIFQTIPSLALLAFLIPILGIGVKPTIVALTIYALLPITRNTFTGLQEVPEDNIEAANGLGFTYWQRLRLVELPLALPFIIAGIRTATASTIGIATIAAFIGAGGLGDFITQGLALNSSRLILLGAIPAAALALILDFIIAQIELLFSKHRRRSAHYFKTTLTVAIILATILAIGLCKNAIDALLTDKQDTVVIASKNFTEQFILADLMTDLIKAKTHLKVIKKLNLGTTAIVQNALLKGSIDLYPEYTGTAYVVVLHQTQRQDAQQTYQVVKENYKNLYHLIWLAPFGFNNSQTIAIPKAFAQEHNLTTLSNLTPFTPNMIIAAPAEFLKRYDGLPGLKAMYHFHFRKVLQVQPDLMYQAIQKGLVHTIAAFTTDGRIMAFNLVALEDDKHFYPPYYAAPVIRESILKTHPEIRQALAPLAGLIDNTTMRQLNYQVDVGHKTPAEVAKQFLVQKGLL